MARVNLALQLIDSDGLEPAYTSGDATNHHSFDNTTEDVFLFVKNDNTVSLNVVFDVPLTVDGDLAVPDRTVTLPAADERMIGRFRRKVYSQADAGNSLDEAVLFSVSVGGANTKLAAIRCPLT